LSIAIVLIRRYVPESPVRVNAPLDIPGALLLSASLITLLLGLTEGESWGWTSGRLIGTLGLAVVLFASWGVIERRSRAPMVDLRMLSQPTVLRTNITTLIAGFALFGCFVLVPRFVETSTASGYGFGASATIGGLYLLPSSIALLFAGPIAGIAGRRWGSKVPLAAGMLLISVCATLLGFAHDRPWHIIVATAALGAGVGAALATAPALVTENVRQTETGVATGINTVVRMVGAVIGGQIAAALLTAETIGNTTVPAERAYTAAFGCSAVAALLAFFVALSIDRRPQRVLAPAEALD